MQQLLDEAARMPDSAIRFARDIAQVWTPDHLTDLRDTVRKKHAGELTSLFAAIDSRFGTTGARDNYVNVFYAAGEMAVMEYVGRKTLSDQDRNQLRDLWSTLLVQE